MTNTSALKKKSASKGDLPERGAGVSEVISNDTRKKDEKPKKKPLQVMVEEAEFNEFSKKAAEMFGHVKGAKSLYFSHIFSKMIS
jgi:hypothetical protein